MYKPVNKPKNEYTFKYTLLECIKRSKNIKIYFLIIGIVFITNSVSTYSWTSYAQTGNLNNFMLFMVMTYVSTIIQYYSASIKRNIAVDVIKITYSIYGQKFANLRGEIKQNSEGKKWRYKFSRFSRAINFSLTWGLDEMIRWTSILTNIMALFYLSFKSTLLLVVIQIIVNFTFVKSHKKKIIELKKTANTKVDKYNHSNSNLYSVFGLFGRNDSIIMNKIQTTQVNIEQVYVPTNIAWDDYSMKLKFVNQLPVIFLVLSEYSTISLKDILIIIMTIQSITGTFSSIFRYLNNIERWKSDGETIYEFYKKNDDNCIVQCEQFRLPKNLEFIINHTLTDEKRRFHIYSRKEIKFVKGHHILINGRSGNGKTTLNRIIAGYYDYASSMNSKYPKGFHHFRDVICETAAGNMKSLNFDSTIRTQMNCIITLTDIQINEILRIVCLDQWVDSDVGGLDIDIKGNISDGQKLRLSLAIMLTQMYTTKEKDLLILDEIDQNIEEETALEIINNIFKKFNDTTIMLVVHTSKLKDTLKFDSTISVANGIIDQTFNDTA
jgi:ABC-type transport system involved in cytochrome bd biosynthesis fused ATPase/permease subunit